MYFLCFLNLIIACLNPCFLSFETLLTAVKTNITLSTTFLFYLA